MKAKMTHDGRINLPDEWRRADSIQPGQEFDLQRLARGEYRLSRSEGSANGGLVHWLKSCPEKGYFVPIPSESTDTL